MAQPASEPTSLAGRMVIISPCRDEAEYAQRTIDSMVAQSRRPDLWLVVDDGSTDATPDMLAAASAEHDWIRVLRREDRGHRAVGPGVVDAFLAGLAGVDLADVAILGKFDLDVDLPPRYLERLEGRFAADPRLGTCSGKPYFLDGAGRRVSEKISDEMSAGMTKLWRRACYEDIGGLVREVMWDGIDCHRCRMHGWKACSFDDPELAFEHLRPMGSSQKGIWTGRTRHGFGQWFMGTSFPYMTASAVYRMTRPPLLIGGLAMWWGYVKAMLGGERRYEDREFRSFLRRYQWSSLLRGKRATVARLDAAGEARWQRRFGAA